MELSEAKQIMNELKNRAEEFNNLYTPDATEFTAKLIPTIDTVLKALDNSISKDEIMKKIEELEENNLEIDFSWDSDDVIIAKRMDMGKLEGFKELLGEE